MDPTRFALAGHGALRDNPWFLMLLVATLAMEYALLRWSGRTAYDWRESAATLGVALGQRLIKPVTALAYAGVLGAAWSMRLVTLPLDRWWSIPVVLLAVEFAYYWYHRASHVVRVFWASHLVHHSVERLNLSAAARLGWTSGLTGAPLFFVPLVLLGIPPTAVVLALGVNLLYQFWLHTELVPKLGPLEWVLNTPSHHRVHHASNEAYLDRNFGGMLIVFDRLFGTVAEERDDERCRYGLTEPVVSHNPLRIALHGWLVLAHDIGADLRCGHWRRLPWRLFAAPGWRPDSDTAALRDPLSPSHERLIP
jgi:sterol desaturase/sphingolipid hydroxylase (fatty acid hydroxylase superfamily)